MSSFTPKEQRDFKRKKFIKDHTFEWVAETVISLVFILLVLWLCQAKSFTVGIISTIIYNFSKILCQIKWYDKDYLQKDIK